MGVGTIFVMSRTENQCMSLLSEHILRFESYLPITLDFLDNTQEYESVMAQCVTIVSEVIPPNKLRNLLLAKISKCEIKDIELSFGDVSKLEFIFSRGEANWIIDEYPDYVDFLLWGKNYETV